MFMYETKVNIGSNEAPEFVEALAIVFNTNKPAANPEDCDIVVYKKNDDTVILKVGDTEIEGDEAVG